MTRWLFLCTADLRRGVAVRREHDRDVLALSKQGGAEAGLPRDETVHRVSAEHPTRKPKTGKESPTSLPFVAASFGVRLLHSGGMNGNLFYGGLPLVLSVCVQALVPLMTRFFHFHFL